MNEHAMAGMTGSAFFAYPLFLLLLLSFPSAPLCAADIDGDGLDDAWEAAQGYSTLLYTRIIYVDAVNGDDVSGDGLSAATAFRSLGAALACNFASGDENVVLAAPGTYSGASNRGLSFGGRDIWLRSSGGAALTVVDLESSGRLLSLTQGETLASRLEGFTVRNGYMDQYGTAIHLADASLDIRDCVFEGNCSGREVVHDFGYGYVETWWEGGVSAAPVYASGAPVRISGCTFRANASIGGSMWMPQAGSAGAVLLMEADGSAIADTSFLGNRGEGAGAVAIYGSGTSVSRCRFLRNVSFGTGGGLAATSQWTSPAGDFDLALENCLFLGNKAFGDASAMDLGDGCAATLKHVTIAGGSAPGGHALRCLEEADVCNCILDGGLLLGNGALFAADHCCAPESLAAYGSGNICGDPGLTAAGFLTGASFCRGAGGTAGHVATDIAGNTRPLTDIDLGCRVFRDTDDDGLPDDVESAAGLNPASGADAAGDADNDGIANLQEYLLGTDLSSADTDGDGIGDATEAGQGYDPAWPTRIIHVSPTGDDDGDGLSAATAKATLSAAVALSSTCAWDNVVLVAAGTYTGASNCGLDFGGYDILLRGAGAQSTVVDMDGAGRFLSASGTETLASRLEGLCLRGGLAASGAAISVSQASLTVRGCRVENCATSGGGMIPGLGGGCGALSVTSGGTLLVRECTLQGNYAESGAALAASDGASLIVEGTTLEGNAASGSGGAVHLDSAEAAFSGCRIVGNRADYAGGGVAVSGMPASLVLENVLMQGNKAMSLAADLRSDYAGQQVSLLNCTIVAGTSPDGVSISLSGQADLRNSIFTGAVSFGGTPPTASHNRAPADWSCYGTGNISVDPMLTPSGMLRAGSPCIDAGTTPPSPGKDLFGNARPAGQAVDIGCHEFLDADADGIPDFLEGSGGLLPNGDADNDGLSNLQEYLLGTDMNAADTDGDGMGDSAELAAGYDPLRFTNLLYVSTNGSDLADGSSPANAFATLGAAVAAAQEEATRENVVLVAAGTYAGAPNRNLDFNGTDIKLISTAGSASTIIDLDGAGRLLSLSHGETLASRLEGFTVRNGYADSHGTAISLSNASLDIRNCVFEGNCSGRKVTYDYGNGQSESYWEGGTASAAVYAAGAPVRITGTAFRRNISREATFGDIGADLGVGNAGALLLRESSGSVVDGCRFDGNQGHGAGAVSLYGATVDFRKCRFVRNVSSGSGGAVTASSGYYYYGDPGQAAPEAAFANCLFLDNRAMSDFSDLNFGDGCGAALVNATFCGGKATGGHAVRFGGATIVLNCVLTGTATIGNYATLSADYCCTLDDWTANGSGNICSAPMLTPSGMLRAGSPCIDAGASTNAPSSDLYGNTRPAGISVDIGCHEFHDADEDGIPDFLEGVSGLLPNGDADNDGLSNLQEYLLGTDMNAADTDGDGMGDSAELAAGYDPICFTNLLYVSPSGNDSASGLSPASALASLGAAVAAAQEEATRENVVLVAAGTYAGAPNRSLDFNGTDIKLIATGGAALTTIDLQSSGRFLSLSHGETLASRLEGFTVRNGYADSHGTAISLSNASLDIRNCVFEGNCSGRKVTYDYGNGQSESHWEGGTASAAVYASGAPVRITGTTFRRNVSREATFGDIGADLGVGNAGALLLRESSGSAVEDCRFEGNQGHGAGAVSLYDATASFAACVFRHNFSTGYGGALTAFAGWNYYGAFGEIHPCLFLENCLLQGNRALTDCSDLYGGDYFDVSLVHTTIFGGQAAGGHGIRLGGDCAAANSILQGDCALGDCATLSADRNCTSDDWTSNGTGNITSDPLLTGAGMLKAESPCIDAGTSTAMPSTDLFGNARPAGQAVDIGCHEFLDADEDGIPDFLEGSGGLLPNGDADNDGLANIDEYLLGTDINAADTDGDGMADAAEIAQGRKPLLPTLVVHVSPSGNDANDGQTATYAKRTLASAIGAVQIPGTEAVVTLGPGLYAGSGNRNLNPEGYDIAFVSSAGASQTRIDLGEGSVFLTLNHGESSGSRLAGLTFLNGRETLPAIQLNGTSLTISGCVFRGFGHVGDVADYMYYGEDYTTACLLKAVDASCAIEDTEITRCAFLPDCALIVASGTALSLERCRIHGNTSGCGSLLRFRESQVAMTNVMIAKNNTSVSGGILQLDSGPWTSGNSLLMLVNCTVAENTDGTAPVLSGTGAVEMVNTVFRGRVDGCALGLSHCAVDGAYAGAGDHCFVPEGLAGGIFLTSQSSCIDAGTAQGAPATDLAGTARPQGEAVDVGCEEYRDSNADGISDFYDFWCGGNLQPEGDMDGDGLTNLQEMLLGTDAGDGDSDGDGLADGWEAAFGTDPLRNDADEDPDGDGLANWEELQAGTDPQEADTDGDGRDDGWEVRVAFSNPAQADFDGGQTAVLSLTGNLFTDSDGGWEADGTAARARGRSGWLQYSLQVPANGIYMLEVSVSEAGIGASAFDLSCSIDGASTGALMRIPLATGRTGTGCCLTPFLRSGAHAVRLGWNNVYRNTSLRVDSLRLLALSGPDVDEDGLPDWAETRLDAMSAAALPARSLVSPVCVEGGNASFIEQIEISGYYIPSGGTDPEPEARRIAGNRWFADLPLDPDGETPVSVTVTYQDSAVSVSGNILWEAVDTASLEALDIRRGDELLLGADLPEGVQSWTLTVGGVSYAMGRGDVRRQAFGTAGEVAVSAAWTGLDSQEHVNAAVVRVHSADLGGAHVCHVHSERRWNAAASDDGIHTEIDRDIQTTALGYADGAFRFLIEGRTPATAYATARLGEGGPVLDTARIHVIETSTHVGDGYHRVIADFGDGTVLYDGYVVAGQVVEGMSVTVTLWGTNSTFEDGTQEKTFTWRNFDASGELHFSILGGRSFTTCMTVILCQDGEEVWRLQ